MKGCDVTGLEGNVLELAGLAETWLWNNSLVSWQQWPRALGLELGILVRDGAQLWAPTWELMATLSRSRAPQDVLRA